MSAQKQRKGTILSRCFICAFFLFALLVIATIGNASNPAFSVVPDQYLHPTTDPIEARELADQYHLTLDSVKSHYSVFLASEETDPDVLLSMGFTYNAISSLSAPPWKDTEDPYLDQQYGLELTRTLEAWEFQGTNIIRVAIIDTGIDIDHAEFQGKISLLSYNAVTDSVGIVNVRDDIGHGTMVAGIIGAIKDNSRGIAGIVPAVELLVIKANNSGEKTFSDSAIVDGIYYAIENGAKVINLSLGGSYANPLTEAAIAHAKENGVLVVASSGNDGTSEPMYPASFSDSISVSAIGPTRLIASFSNFGSEVDLTAPGESVITTAMGNGYATVDGTSFSAPHVAGILALFLSRYPEMQANEVVARLNQTAIDLGEVGRDDYYGHGLVDAFSLLSKSFVQISFETYLMNDPEPIFIPENSRIPEPIDPFMPDKIFVGWFQESEFFTEWNFLTDVATQDLTLYAKYTSEFHTVTFMTEGTAVEPQFVRHGESILLPTTSLPEANFNGWFLDAGFQNPYSGEPVETDLTLYAKFDPIVYVQVSLIGSHDSITTHILEAGSLFSPDDLVVEGYLFQGWYLDQDFLLLYEPIQINEDLSLYALLEPLMCFVSLILPDQEPIILEVAYGDIPVFPEITLGGLDFAGWYVDENFVIPYQNEPITVSIDLYARVVESAFKVTLFIDTLTMIDIYVLEGLTVTIVSPEKVGMDFLGWFWDSDGQAAYNGEAIMMDTQLYAVFTEKILTVRFYAADQTTIYQIETVVYGLSLTPPAPPIKAPTPSMTFEFSQWSEELSCITEDLQVYPLYDVLFQEESVALNPGIDTVMTGSDWIDEGVSNLDSFLQVTTTSLVDTLVSGKYPVKYQFYYEESLVYELIRYVRVIENLPSVTITLHPGVTTIFVGDTYEDGGATSSQGTIETIGSVDTSSPGVYQVQYRVNIAGYEFTKSRYVTVVEKTNPCSLDFVWVKRKEIYEA
ncbi:MAG: S8 family serine peptidase [Candidatus Izemoplasmatales bacterium]|nr:S8 family serine peptidase [Candidatus Izemoplasmatales bacterium]